MCVQGEITGDPKNLPSNSRVILSTQCTLYFPGVDIPHALQFKFTPGGSLREIKSGKCITSTLGSLQTPLTFSDSCDTAGNKISFVGMLIATHKVSRYRMRAHISCQSKMCLHKTAELQGRRLLLEKQNHLLF